MDKISASRGATVVAAGIDMAKSTFSACVILPRFHVHQIVDNRLMNGGGDGQEGIGTEAGVHRGVQG